MSPRDDEEDRQRARIHKLADTVQAHETRLAELGALMTMVTRSLEIVQGTMVDRELLNITVGSSLTRIETLHNETKLKFEHVETKISNVNDNLQPIKRAIYWAATLIIGAVILAVLGLVLSGGSISSGP